jgi:hypothetical protein
MPINHLNHTWIHRIMELRPQQRITQVRNFVWLIVGIFQSRSVCLSRIAGKIPGRAKLLSTTRRLSRLTTTPSISDRNWAAFSNGIQTPSRTRHACRRGIKPPGNNSSCSSRGKKGCSTFGTNLIPSLENHFLSTLCL